MKPITDKQNTDVASSTWPYGKIKDKTSTESGTPVNADVYQDHHQFFSKLMDAANITPNGQLDNASNGFQLHDAHVASIETMIKAYLLSIVGASNVSTNQYYFFGNNLYHATTKIEGLTVTNELDPISQNCYTFVYINDNIYLYAGNPLTGDSEEYGYYKGFKTIRWKNGSPSVITSVWLYSLGAFNNREILDNTEDVDLDLNLGYASPVINGFYARFNDKVITITTDLTYNIYLGNIVILNIGRSLKKYRLRIQGLYSKDLSDIDENTQFHIFHSMKNASNTGGIDPDVIYGMSSSSNNSLLVIDISSPSGSNYRGKFTATFFLEKY